MHVLSLFILFTGAKIVNMFLMKNLIPMNSICGTTFLISRQFFNFVIINTFNNFHSLSLKKKRCLQQLSYLCYVSLM